MKLCSGGETSPKNIKQIQNYIYDSDYAHRLKSINNQTFFLYDKNGNIIETSDESYEPKYDAQFRTFLNSQGATIYTFKYDPVTGDAPLVPRKPDRVNRRNFNERNMMSQSEGIMEDTVNYSYDEEKKRTHKDNTNDDKYSLIFNDYYSIYFSHHNRTGEHYNNIMLGSTRLAIEIFNKENAMNPNRTYFFHSDHLGSTTLITDTNGDIYQYTEYTPYGEVWAEVTQNKTWEYFYFNASYRFTGKPRDEETGYYYFGARYFDPRLNIWTTSDPALVGYFDDSSKGEGGVFNSINLNAYHYGRNNPIKYVDPDGNADKLADFIVLPSFCLSPNFNNTSVSKNQAECYKNMDDVIDKLSNIPYYDDSQPMIKEQTILKDVQLKGGNIMFAIAMGLESMGNNGDEHLPGPSLLTGIGAAIENSDIGSIVLIVCKGKNSKKNNEWLIMEKQYDIRKKNKTNYVFNRKEAFEYLYKNKERIEKDNDTFKKLCNAVSD